MPTCASFRLLTYPTVAALLLVSMLTMSSALAASIDERREGVQNASGRSRGEPTEGSVSSSILWTSKNIGNKRGKTTHPNYYWRLLGDADGTHIFAEGEESPSGSFGRPTINAIDRSTGAIAWTYKGPHKSNSHHMSAAALGGSNLFYTELDYSQSSPKAAVYALSRSTGSVSWTYTVSSSPLHNTMSVPTVHGKVVYVNAGGAFLALDASTGSLLWNTSCAAGQLLMSPEPVIASNGDLVVASCAQSLTAFSTSTGAVSWTLPQSLYVESFVASSTNGGDELILNTGANTFRTQGYSAANGTLLWTKTFSQLDGTSRMVTAPGLIIRSEFNDNTLASSIVARNTSTSSGGDPVWSYGTTTSFFISVPCVSGSHAFATAPLKDKTLGHHVGALYKVDMDSGVGSVAARVPPPSGWFFDATGPPLVLGDVVYFIVASTSTLTLEGDGAMVAAVSGAV